VLDTRAFAVIADADELLARPALLAAFAGAFGPDADATLVLAASDVNALSAGFPAAAAAVGLDDDELPDVLALAGGSLAHASDWLAGHVHAVLSEERHGGVWAALPHCSVADGQRLLRLGALHAELARIRSDLPARLALPQRYTSRDAPEYFDDVHRVDADIVHQPDVYGAAAALARRTGATHIVDIGCGAAEKLLALAPEFHLVGVDFGENLEHCRRAHPRHTWLQWDIEREPLPELPVALLRRAVVVCADVIEHLVDPAGLLGGLRRLARDAEAILLSTPDRERVRGPLDPGPPQNPAHVREWKLDELVALLDAGGLPPAFAGHTVNNDRQLLKRTSVAIVDGRRGGPIEPAPEDFAVTAVLPAFNEADVVEHSVRRLVAQGVCVHVVDNWSTDDTVARVEALGLGDRVRVERFPADAPSATYDWAALLRNTERIAADLGDGWVIHQDVDEVRESPWPGVGLRDALHHVQRCGFDAVDHTVIDFVPVDDDFVAGSDVEAHMRHFRFGDRPGHFVQVKAWRTGSGAVDLASSGGHDARFPGRRVFPYKFLAKHYPVRSQRHGERKVFAERVARWNPGERALGWHHQYEPVARDHAFVRAAGELLRHDDAFATEYVVERVTGVGIVRDGVTAAADRVDRVDRAA
jgi:SAM-dependent methyltransferase